jgi:hypothetical protein
MISYLCQEVYCCIFTKIIIFMQHFYQNIQGWNDQLRPLYELLVPELPDPCHVVEVGAWAGKSTAHMSVLLINSGKRFQFGVVDHWQGANHSYYQDPSVQQRDVYREFLDNLNPVLHLLDLHKCASVDAAKRYADHSLDMVVIDEDHNYEPTFASIAAWIPKVKPGGFICGDDHIPEFPGVIRACTDFFGKRYSIINHDNVIVKAEHAEHYGSWFIQL